MISASQSRSARGVSERAAGVAAALLTVAIWAGWIVATRHSVVSHLGPVDVGLLRFGLPAAVLAPVWLRVGLLPRGVPPWILAIIVAGSGAPFFLIAATGMRFAPAAHIGALLPGTMPLWAALIALVLFRERFTPWRVAGYGLIAAGVLAITGADAAAGEGTWRGHLLFLTGAAFWAAYTHAFRRSGLSALQAAGVVSAWSFLMHAALALALGTELPAAPAGEVVLQLVTQGGLSGLVAIVAYGLAVRRLGAAPAAAFSALAPVLAALGGLVFLGEAPGPRDLVAVVCVTAGVALATGLVLRRG